MEHALDMAGVAPCKSVRRNELSRSRTGGENRNKIENCNQKLNEKR